MSCQRFVLTPEARADLLEIWAYIAEDSIDQADLVVARLYDAFTRLGQAPGIGHHREGLADARHRFWAVHSYVIAYRWETTLLQIIAIVHGARQLDSFFQQRIGAEEAEAGQGQRGTQADD